MPSSRRRLSLALALTCLLGAVTAVSPAIGDPPPAAPVEVQILATNDFHGRIANDPGSSAAGAAVMAGAVKQLRTANPNTVFTAAGDLIGASTFESFIDQDKPTIDALNEAGLEVSAAGNHEFDQGYADLVNRVMAPESPSNPKGGAQWKYLAANVRFKANDSPALDGTWIKTMSGVDVGFVGAVTEDLPSLVTPSGIATIKVTDIVQETNAAAADLKAAGADVVVLLVHEGAPGASCSAIAADTTSKFGKIVAGVSDDVDAIVSGHTHLEYNCSLPVPGWSSRPVKERPVVSAGQYGANLNQLLYTVDPATGEVQGKSQTVLKLKAANGGPFNYPADPATQTIVTNALANADVLGAAPLGQIGGAFNRAKLANGTTENRGGESTLGNLVAEVHRWATSAPESGAAQIAFMNPGGLRADMTGTGAGAFPRSLTYRQAATVQPFANTLVNMQMTGAQIKAALEQQWQPSGAARPFLNLGTSKGFRYTFDASRPEGSRITGMWLDGTPIQAGTSYSVTVNSFLAAGGDNFPAFTTGANPRDTGKADLQAMVDYMATLTGGSNPPLPVDFSQRSVGVRFPSGAPSAYQPGAVVSFNLSSLSMTTADDVKDTSVAVKLGTQTLGTFPVTTVVQTALPGFDETGTASVSFTLPAGTTAGPRDLVIEGNATGTVVTVPITVAKTRSLSAPPATITWGDATSVDVTVTGNAGMPTGSVEVLDGATKLGEAPLNASGVATVPLPARSVAPGVNADHQVLRRRDLRRRHRDLRPDRAARRDDRGRERHRRDGRCGRDRRGRRVLDGRRHAGGHRGGPQRRHESGLGAASGREGHRDARDRGPLARYVHADRVVPGQRGLLLRREDVHADDQPAPGGLAAEPHAAADHATARPRRRGAAGAGEHGMRGRPHLHRDAAPGQGPAPGLRHPEVPREDHAAASQRSEPGRHGRRPRPAARHVHGDPHRPDGHRPQGRASGDLPGLPRRRLSLARSGGPSRAGRRAVMPRTARWRRCGGSR